MLSRINLSYNISAPNTFSCSMRNTALIFLVVALFACTNKASKAPDVSKVEVNLAVQRFDADFFSLDTLNMNNGIATLEQKYPRLLPVFLENIVGVENLEGVRSFYALYKPVFDSAQRIYRDFTPVQKQLEQAFRYVKFYFPDYTLPRSIVAVVGPMNSREDLARMANGEYTPNFIGPDFIGISLQFYLGKDFSLYQEPYFINNVAPLYRSRRFAKEYISADVMKLVADDLFPDRSAAKPLIEQMIEKGKQWWLLDKIMPQAPDSVKTGFTSKQLAWCEENEGLCWTYITKHEQLYSIDPATLQTYIGESPFTSVFDQEQSPGNIGPWFGRQIVRKFEEKNPGLTLTEVMQTPATKILEEAKYKPK